MQFLKIAIFFRTFFSKIRIYREAEKRFERFYLFTKPFRLFKWAIVEKEGRILKLSKRYSQFLITVPEREKLRDKKIKAAVVVAQLAEQLLLTPEIRGLNPDIGYENFQMCICQLLFRKDKNKEKEVGNGPF